MVLSVPVVSVSKLSSLWDQLHVDERPGQLPCSFLASFQNTASIKQQWCFPSATSQHRWAHRELERVTESTRARGTAREATVGACLESAWKEGSVQTHKASVGKQSRKRETQAGLLPFLWHCIQCLCRLERGGEKRICICTQKNTCIPPPTCANSHRVPSLLAADRPVMGIYFPQL